MECRRAMAARALSRSPQRRSAVSPSRPSLVEETSTHQRRARRSLVVVDQVRFRRRRFRPNPRGRQHYSRTRRSLHASITGEPVQNAIEPWFLPRPLPAQTLSRPPEGALSQARNHRRARFLGKGHRPDPGTEATFALLLRTLRQRRSWTTTEDLPTADEGVSSLNEQREDESTISHARKQARACVHAYDRQ